MGDEDDPADALAAALGLRPLDASGVQEQDERWVVYDPAVRQRLWGEHQPEIVAILVALIRKELPLAEATARMRVVVQTIHEEARREEDGFSGSEE